MKDDFWSADPDDRYQEKKIKLKEFYINESDRIQFDQGNLVLTKEAMDRGWEIELSGVQPFELMKNHLKSDPVLEGMIKMETDEGHELRGHAIVTRVDENGREVYLSGSGKLDGIEE
jgi:hypothetical protein